MHTARRGFTLLEVMVGAAILAIAIMGLMAVLTATSRLQQSNRETTQALNAIRDTLEELRNYPNFNELSTASGGANQNEPLLRFYTQSGTNPRSGLPWDTFAVFGLNAAAAWSSRPTPSIFPPGRRTATSSPRPTWSWTSAAASFPSW